MTTQQQIHWLGAGLSSGRGISRLVNSGANVALYNRTLEKAEKLVRELGFDIAQVALRKLDLQTLQSSVSKGDIIVSMLPAPFHPQVAEICLSAGCHLVTTSYLSDAMKNLNTPARERGLSFVNEVGLDPGIDHLFAHRLVSDFNESGHMTSDLRFTFRSYCGGFPKTPNDFKYKFSWSPVGVLRALKSPAKYIREGSIRTAAEPWKALTTLAIRGEDFEVYPNRDSVPYLSEYHFGSSWRIDEFVRGTIRLAGWSEAWSTIFARLHTATSEELERIGEELWSKYAYSSGEEDRVVLHVSLAATRNGATVWSKSLTLDESGSGRDSAMARLVSLPAALAVQSILDGRSKPGVSAAPSEAAETQRWLSTLQEEEGVRIFEE